MKKLLTIVAAIGLSMGVVQAQEAGKVELTLSAPGQATAGEEFTVTLTIAKQSLTGFARFHQDLPKGFEAVQVSDSNEGAVFSFADQRLRLIWANLPEAPDIKVSYRIRVIDSRLKGNLLLAGRFTYVVGDERQAADVESSPITITPANPQQSIDIEAYQSGEEPPVAATPAAPAAAAPAPAAAPVAAAPAASAAAPAAAAKPDTAAVPAAVPSSDVFVVRQKPYMVDKDYYVNLQLTKGALSGFGKVEEEQLSPNAKVEAIETKGALFLTEGNKISFTWINLPTDSGDFVVSYKVTPWQEGAPLSLKGVFTYNNGGNMETVNVAERDVDFSSSVPVPSLAAAQAEQASLAAQQPREQPRKPTLQRGLVFKVQLLATKTSVGDDAAIEAHFAQYNVTEPVVEEVQGFDPTQFVYKYVVGPFKKYEQAANMRDQMWTRGITDAFVTCYYNGDRITIQEALMISNKKR